MVKTNQAHFVFFLAVSNVILLICLFFLPLFGSSTKAENSEVDTSTVKINGIVKDENKLALVLKKIGIKNTMAKLVAESAGGSSFDCHQQAHTIGRVGYKIYKEEAFRDGDFSCHSGVYHGAMEAFLNENGTENLAKNIEGICDKFESYFGKFECLHGVGHGILAYVDYDMPEAITDCKQLKDSWSQSSCYGGMFMENVLTGQGLGAGTNNHKTSWVNNTDPYFPCNKIGQEYALQYECYQMQTSWMLTMTSYNFDKVRAYCLSADSEFREVCFRSFGRDVAGQTLRNPEKIMTYCDKIPKSPSAGYYDQCISGSMNVIVDFWGQGLNNQAADLCKLVKGESKKNCYGELSGRFNDLFTKAQDRNKHCGAFENEYIGRCLQTTNSQ